MSKMKMYYIDGEGERKIYPRNYEYTGNFSALSLKRYFCGESGWRASDLHPLDSVQWEQDNYVAFYHKKGNYCVGALYYD